MKNSRIIIAITLVISMMAPVAHSQEEAPPVAESPVVKACKGKLPEFEKLEDKAYSTFQIRGFYRSANREYHRYVQCIFDGSFKEVLGSSGADTEGFFRAESPNLIIPEFMNPDTACLAPDQLNKVIQNGNPSNILPALIGAYSQYSEYLDSLITHHKQNQLVDENFNFSGAVSDLKELENDFRNEIQDALIGMDNAFVALKELRLGFVMHVQFQCILGSLEKLRDMLANIRSNVMELPFLIPDASCS